MLFQVMTSDSPSASSESHALVLVMRLGVGVFPSCTYTSAGQFGVSKRTLERLIAERAIPRYRRTGDRKMYVSRAEVVKHLGFQEIRAPYD